MIKTYLYEITYYKIILITKWRLWDYAVKLRYRRIIFSNKDVVE